MRKSIIIIFGFFLVILLFFNCRKIESPTTVSEGQLEKVNLMDLSGIPESYGKLMAVTTHAQYEGWAQLWFEDSVQTIRMVRIQFHSNRIHDQVLVIPRTK
jgi:hypothetical protein